MAVTVDDLRERLESDMEDAVLQRILDAAVEDIAEHAGSATSVTEVHSALGAPTIALGRPASSITSIKERLSLTSDEVTLASDDYRQDGPYKLARIPGGTNSSTYWGKRVEVIYAPDADADLRDRVTLDLAVMDAEFQAADTSAEGDHSESQDDFHRRREGLLRQIREGRSPIA